MGVRPMVAAASLVVALGMVWAAPALTAGSQAGSPEAQAKTSKADTSRRICRNLVLSGTRLSRRACRTARAWEEDAEAARRLQSDGAYDGQYRDGTGQMGGGPRR